jgi:(4S)-4-hydroxy-5-phosphonooxypentane-2,3-dione isomerase
MFIVHVHIKVKAESVSDFITATVENARQSLLEPGIARFDVLQDRSNPQLFVLCEAYRSADAPAQHKATAHYQKWLDAVTDMMAEPRTREQFSNVFPEDQAF